MNDGAVIELFQGVRLTPTQRRIAHSLIANAAAAAYLSAAEVAALAGVSQPSVTRFAMALGYDGYPALRQRLRDLLHAGGAAATDPGGNEVQRAVRAETDNLVRLADQLADLEPVTTAGAVLAGTSPLPVLGLRAAAPLAAYFGFFAAKVHPDVRVLDTGGSQLADRLEQARAAGATAILAVVLPRYPREALDALRAARELGLRLVALTDSPVSPVAELADHPLAAAVGGRLVFDLHTAPMALAMVLLQAMCDALGESVQIRLEEFESSAARRQLFAG
ncbi:MAG TPA: MurR/RpiR family transcriptional regulator [Pilimelia sp.]|nr:MurR/RpiR family transcriptional regulator [Pilimelia sp.]